MVDSRLISALFEAPPTLARYRVLRRFVTAQSIPLPTSQFELRHLLRQTQQLAVHMQSRIVTGTDFEKRVQDVLDSADKIQKFLLELYDELLPRSKWWIRVAPWAWWWILGFKYITGQLKLDFPFKREIEERRVLLAADFSEKAWLAWQLNCPSWAPLEYFSGDTRDHMRFCFRKSVKLLRSHKTVKMPDSGPEAVSMRIWHAPEVLRFWVPTTACFGISKGCRDLEERIVKSLGAIDSLQLGAVPRIASAVEELARTGSAVPANPVVVLQTGAGDDLAEPRDTQTTDQAPDADGKPNPLHEVAYQSYALAERALAEGHADTRRVLDREAYEWLEQNGPQEYRMPTFETWQRYVRNGRKFHDTQKNTPRAGRTSRSVASTDDVQVRREPDDG